MASPFLTTEDAKLTPMVFDCYIISIYCPEDKILCSQITNCLRIGNNSVVAVVAGDVLLHCVVDAILGALGLPDIGQLFPDTDPKWKGAPSSVFIKEAVSLSEIDAF